MLLIVLFGSYYSFYQADQGFFMSISHHAVSVSLLPTRSPSRSAQPQRRLKSWQIQTYTNQLMDISWDGRLMRSKFWSFYKSIPAAARVHLHSPLEWRMKVRTLLFSPFPPSWKNSCRETMVTKNVEKFGRVFPPCPNRLFFAHNSSRTTLVGVGVRSVQKSFLKALICQLSLHFPQHDL